MWGTGRRLNRSSNSPGIAALQKLTVKIREDDLEQFEAWFASHFAGRKDSYAVESFEPDPNSSAVVYSVSLKIARQADVGALNAYLAGIGAAH
jgi:hypothetical protein